MGLFGIGLKASAGAKNTRYGRSTRTRLVREGPTGDANGLSAPRLLADLHTLYRMVHSGNGHVWIDGPILEDSYEEQASLFTVGLFYSY